LLKFTSRYKLATCLTENFKLIVISRSILFNPKYIRNYSAAGLCPDPMGELTVLLRLPIAGLSGQGPRKRRGRGRGMEKTGEKNRKEAEGKRMG